MPDEKAQAEQYEQSLKDQAKEYKKLQKISDSSEFNDYFDFLMATVADKMIWAFTTGKDGDNVKNWEDFCKVRGEIVARLHPIQEVRSAEAMVQYMKKQLDAYYKQPV